MARPRAAMLIEALVATGCVVGAVLVLSWLDEMPMPKTGSIITANYLKDVKFWSPPLAAVAILAFSAKTVPALDNMVLGILGSTAMAVFSVHAFGPGKLARAGAAGGAMLWMKLSGKSYPPAAALAVLFVDNPKIGELGIFNCLMPGLSGSSVLYLLAVCKIRILSALRPAFKRCDKTGELTAPLLP
mmetsp:Transcript_81800/g.162327  ORF Transcript_81800/g.162327 Transcript_81800/m.162327 type:complete len:187 (+) Transcript_81800:61-621(+)|eukprot:CAMPEP_0172683466 /NCGR_PEP_ID=MMETSP1074-20121228/18870_1 /TAXON_ID=2916 /ORGANISM="Ceratium fusus, Strain PA161109" /LENGTH=186 /DNA_ID=CAMNT_0013502313 /DNA_START=54 /DNA_END=614 /DNA_ORIENTATION=-